MSGEGTFDFRVLEPEHRGRNNVLDLGYWVYKVRARADLPQYARKEMEVLRRYKDFEWLRRELADEFPFCIVPPIPEKQPKDILNKISGIADSQQHDYRQRALRKFLIRVGAHPYLRQSKLLQDFLEMDEGEWECRCKISGAGKEKGMAAALASAGSLLQSEWAAEDGESGEAAAYSSILQSGIVTTESLQRARAYLTSLGTSLSQLRERLKDLVERRRTVSSCLSEFGRCLTRVGDLEAALDNPKPPKIAKVISAVGAHAAEVSGVTAQQSDQETRQVVETLTYYIRLCDAVGETLRRVGREVSTRDGFRTKVTKLKEESVRLGGRGGDMAARTLKEAEQAEAALAETERKVAALGGLFAEELRRFHREKQFDIKGVLKIFVELQMEHTRRVRKAYETLAPTVDEARAMAAATPSDAGALADANTKTASQEQDAAQDGF